MIPEMTSSVIRIVVAWENPAAFHQIMMLPMSPGGTG